MRTKGSTFEISKNARFILDFKTALNCICRVFKQNIKTNTCF